MPDRAELFVDAFASVASECGSRTALEDSSGRVLSYAELLASAQDLARALNADGIGNGSVVAIRLPRSTHSVVAMLAVWFARAAWVPIDPAWPDQRTEFVMSDVGAHATIVHHYGGLRILAANPIATASIAQSSPDDLAYVIYTSGSTGSPKGVQVTHRGLSDVLRAQIRAFHLGPDSRVLQVLSTSFDASISDIGTALLSGATLLIDAQPLTRARLLDSLTRYGITHADLPPALLPLVEPSDLPPSLQTVIVGGEPSAVETMRSWARRVHLVNVYGPTEATICTSLCDCDPETWCRPLIGDPLPGVRYEVVDAKMSRSAPGQPGELLIFGPGLAIGYVNRPELTRAKFITFEGQRAYRTGDKVRQHPDGSFEFLGRLDRQIKLRGLLIAPEEIEACLCEHPLVKRAAVFVQTTARRAPQLVAVVASSSDDLTADTLRWHTLAKLPAWMCPRRFDIRSSLPELSSGKVDLHEFETRPISTESDAESRPRGETERALASIWCHVLGLDTIDRHANFFSLGGDSFAVVECLALAEARGLALPAEAIYEHGTLAAIAHGHAPAEGRPASELRTDARRAFDAIALSPRHRGDNAAVDSVLLTGATGFLGARVLCELLRSTTALIHCLVRAPSRDAGMDRVRSALRDQGRRLPNDSEGRIAVVTGDLARPHFGLCPDTWRTLTRTVTSVYHLAANVNLVLPYERLRDANVLGTANVAHFVREGGEKHLHYASTLSVGACVLPLDKVFSEDDDLARTEVVFGGYAQSKWAAEIVVQLLADSNERVTVYRLGLLTGDDETGRAARSCQFRSFLRGIATIGAFPELSNSRADSLRIDVTPVTFAARALVSLSLGRDLRGATFHLASPQPLTLGRLLLALREFGIPIRPVSAEAFRERIRHAEMTRSVAIAAVSACHRILGAEDRHRMCDLFLASDVTFATTRSRSALDPLGVRCPEPSEGLLRRYLHEAFADDKSPSNESVSNESVSP